MSSDPLEVIEPDPGSQFSAERLQHIVGYAVELKLQNGSAVSAVVVAVSESALILNRWDDREHCPVSDPFVIETSEVQTISIY